jgi:hypothetical protein
MTAVTADDVRVLARAAAPDAVLALAGGTVLVVPDADDETVTVTPDQIIYTKAQLIAEYGDELTDVDAEVLAAGLTARARSITGSR